MNSPYLYWAAATPRQAPYPLTRETPTGFVPILSKLKSRYRPNPRRIDER